MQHCSIRSLSPVPPPCLWRSSPDVSMLSAVLFCSFFFLFSVFPPTGVSAIGRCDQLFHLQWKATVRTTQPSQRQWNSQGVGWELPFVQGITHNRLADSIPCSTLHLDGFSFGRRSGSGFVGGFSSVVGWGAVLAFSTRQKLIKSTADLVKAGDSTRQLREDSSVGR